MILISAHTPGNTSEQNARKSSSLLCDILSLVGYDARVTPAIGSWEGVEEQCFAVKVLEHVTDERILGIALGIKELSLKYQQYAIGSIILDAIPPRMTLVTTEDWEYTEYALDTSRVKPPCFIKSWTYMNGTYYFPTKELTIIDELNALQTARTRSN